MSNHLHMDGIHTTLKNSFYTTLSGNRARSNSILAGGVLAMAQVLPAANITKSLDRFFYEIVDPNINNAARTLLATSITSTPTLRTITHTAVSLRFALANNPLGLGKPVEILNWFLIKKDVELFSNATLEIFKKLNISPFEIDIRHLFKAFTEADGDLYKTTMDGIRTYCRRTHTRVNGVDIPLPSITEDELVILAAGYLGILIGYILPLPTTPIDGLERFWTTNILTEAFSLVDQFNEHSIINVDHILKVVKAIYYVRYNAIHTPEYIAHTLMYVLLTPATTMLPPAIINSISEELRDQIADDVRDIIKAGTKEEPIDQYAACTAVGYTSSINYRDLDARVAEAMAVDLEYALTLQSGYSQGALVDNDVIALENLQARYFAFIPASTNPSLESKGGNVSVESKKLLMFGLVGTLIATIVAMLYKGITYLLGAKKELDSAFDKVKDDTTVITNTIKSISEVDIDVLDAIDAVEALDTNETAKRLVNNILKIIARYNPTEKVPTDASLEVKVKYILSELNTVDKISATIFTRADNEKVPQVTSAFGDPRKLKELDNRVHELSLGTVLTTDALAALSDPKVIKDLMEGIKKEGSDVVANFQRDTQAVTDVVSSAAKLTEIITHTVAVNSPDVYKTVDDEAEVVQHLLDVVFERADYLTKVLKTIKDKHEQTLSIVEDAVRSGALDDDAAKQINSLLSKRANECRQTISLSLKTLNALTRHETTYIQYVRDFKKLVLNLDEELKIIKSVIEK